MSDKLRGWSAAGYGVGDFAMSLYWAGVSFFLLYWYTDVVGLPAGVAGFLFFVGAIWDAVSDPTAALLVDRSRSRWGRYRPFLLLGTIPLAASFVLLFWVPPLQGAALIGFLLAAHLVFRTCYTLVAIPYSALSARISHRSEDRTRLAAARMVAATSASLLISAAGFPLVRRLGSGSEATGFFYLAALAGGLAVLAHGLCFVCTREPTPDTDSHERDYRWRELPGLLAANRAFIYLLAMIPLFAMAAALVQKGLVYHLKYGLEAHDRQHVALLVHGSMTLVGTVIWGYVAARCGRRAAWQWSTLGFASAAVGLFLLSSPSFAGFCLLLVPFSLCFAAMGVLFWAMLPDTIEYGEWRSGQRAEAVFFGVATFTQKVAIGFAGWMLGIALGSTGFVADAPQSGTTLLAIRTAMTLAPAAMLVAVVGIVRRYPLTESAHRQIREALKGGRRPVDLPGASTISAP